MSDARRVTPRHAARPHGATVSQGTRGRTEGAAERTRGNPTANATNEHDNDKMVSVKEKFALWSQPPHLWWIYRPRRCVKCQQPTHNYYFIGRASVANEHTWVARVPAMRPCGFLFHAVQSYCLCRQCVSQSQMISYTPSSRYRYPITMLFQ